MIPTRIFLDMDDVLNDFTMYVLRSLGCQVGFYDPEWGWDIVRAHNATHPDTYRNEISFWQAVKRQHWSNAPISDAFAIVVAESINLVGERNVCVLSAPTTDPDCLAGKLEWIHKNMPARLHRQFLIGPCKSMCAGPDALLIDDRDENVDDFRAAGGQAILVPRPWNSLHGVDTMKHLKEAFDELWHRKQEYESRINEANQDRSANTNVHSAHSMDGFTSSILVGEESTPATP